MDEPETENCPVCCYALVGVHALGVRGVPQATGRGAGVTFWSRTISDHPDCTCWSGIKGANAGDCEMHEPYPEMRP